MIYKIPVVWQLTSILEIEAHDLDEACELTHTSFLEMSEYDYKKTLNQSCYVEDSFHINTSSFLIKEMRNEERERKEYARLKAKFEP